MDKNILFLENFHSLLSSGYSIEEALILCYQIIKLPFISSMIDRLKEGDDIQNILINSALPTLFKEYFRFYKNKNCLSEAIEKSVHICKTKKKYEERLKSKLTYPIVLLVFLFLFSIFVIFILLPSVNQLFVSFQIQKNIMIQVLFAFFYVFPIIFVIIIVFIILSIIRLLFALRKKKSKIIEQYLKIPYIRTILQKYFSLKFAIYYYELSLENMDSAAIIQVLNDQMNESDIKIVLYELNNRILDGETIECILEDFEYLDELFLTFFKMYVKNPNQHESIQQYIDVTYQQMDHYISQLLKYFIPCIYCFVAIFVITIYVSIIIPMMNVISDI